MLLILGADKDKDVALRIGEMMFKKLGYDDFTRTVQKADVEIKLLDDPAFVAPQVEDGRLVKAEPRKVFFPDLEQQLPLAGLVALIKRAVTIERQGSASDPVPILDGVDRIRAFEVSEESFRIPAVRVNQVPIRAVYLRRPAQPCAGLYGPDPCRLGRRLQGDRLQRSQ